MLNFNSQTYYANSHGQLLESHLIGVAIRSAQIFDEIEFSESKRDLRSQLILAALLHDIGKLDPNFKNFIDEKVKKNKINSEKYLDAEFERKKNTSNDYIGPFHNEVSWILSKKILSYLSDSQKDNIGYAIYWHHPANLNKDSHFNFSNAKKIYEACKIKEISKNVFDSFIHDLWNYACQIEFLELKKSLYSQINLSIDLTTSPESLEKPDFWQEQTNGSAQKKLLLFILIEADRWISSLSSDELKQFIEMPQNYVGIHKKIQNVKLKPVLENDIRSQNQISVVSEIRRKIPIAVCGIDPGEGKTRIGLRWWLEKSNKFLMVALPKQAQVTGLFKTIQKDLEEIAIDSSKVRVTGFFNGIVQHDSFKENPDTLPDIKILVFDRLLSPCFEISQVSEFIEMLFSDLILDEFHEFMFIPRMLNSVRDILTIRSWLKNTGTLLLSGTPEIPLFKSIGISDDLLIKREILKPHKERLMELNYVDSLPNLKMLNKDTLVANLIVHDSQVNYKNFLEHRGREIPAFLIHSSFTAIGRKEKIDRILEKFSVGDGNGVVFSARLLQSSFDLNFRNGYIALSVPSVDIQFLGRINRFGDKDFDSKVTFYNDNESAHFFNENNFGFSKLYKYWHEFLKQKILENIGRKWKYREIIVEIYEAFWKKEGMIKLSEEEIEESRKKQENSLKEWFPVRFIKTKNKGPIKHNSHKSFREESYCASAIIVDDFGEMTSFLTGEQLLSVSSWKVKKLKDAISNQTAAALNRISRDSQEEIFKFSKYNNTRKGLTPERPLFFSHPNASVNHDLKNGMLSENKLYRVYHHDLGLCTPDLLPIKRMENDYLQCNDEEDLSMKDEPGNLKNYVDDKKENIIDNDDHTLISKEIKAIKKTSPMNLESNLNSSQLVLSGYRKFTQVDEKQVLVPLSRRVPIFYTEYCKVVRRGSDVRILANQIESEFTIPVASIGCLILGPGTSISAEAMRISTSRGCKILVAGGEASPLFLSSTQHRSPISRIRQYSFVMDKEKRLKAGKVLFKYRTKFIDKFGSETIPEFPDSNWIDSIEKMLSVEGTWAKLSYKKLAQKYKTKWNSKQVADDQKHPVVFLNFLTYSIADIAILHLGYDPNVGVLHGRTKGGGLCYDLADVVKPVLALEGAFEAIVNSYTLKEIKEKFMSKVRELDVLDYLVETLNETFKEK